MLVTTRIAIFQVLLVVLKTVHGLLARYAVSTGKQLPTRRRSQADKVRNYLNVDTFLSRTPVGKSSPITGREWPRGFQDVKVPRFRDNGTGWW